MTDKECIEEEGLSLGDFFGSAFEEVAKRKDKVSEKVTVHSDHPYVKAFFEGMGIGFASKEEDSCDSALAEVRNSKGKSKDKSKITMTVKELRQLGLVAGYEIGKLTAERNRLLYEKVQISQMIVEASKRADKLYQTAGQISEQKRVNRVSQPDDKKNFIERLFHRKK